MDTLNKHCFLDRATSVLGKSASGCESPSLSAVWLGGLDSVAPPPADASYTAASSFLRLTNRFTKAQVTNSRCAFFFSPR